MTLSVNWSTKVITVPQADLTLVSGSIYELDLGTFREALLEIEASEDGLTQPAIHRHNTTVTLSGVTYARTIEIINGFTITFEDGQYAVRLVGANSNVEDVTNVNQVSIRSSNSAGLQVVTAGAVVAPTQQQIRDALKLAASSGEPATGSVDDQLRKQNALSNAILGSVV